MAHFQLFARFVPLIEAYAGSNGAADQERIIIRIREMMAEELGWAKELLDEVARMEARAKALEASAHHDHVSAMLELT